MKITKATDSHNWIDSASKMYIIGPKHECYVEQYPNLISVLYRAWCAYIRHGNFNFTIGIIKRDKDGWWY